MRISREQKVPYRVKVAFDAIIARLDNYGIRHTEQLSLDDEGFGHAWIKYYRIDRKAGYIFICSHSDNMDPECCDPIYRFIKVYNYCDDVLDDNFLGETAIYSNIQIDNIESYETWDDNVSYLLSKNGIAWIYIKDPETKKPAIPYTTYPLDIEGLSANWEKSWFAFKQNKNWLSYYNDEASEDINLNEILEKDNVLYLGRTSAENVSYSAISTDGYIQKIQFSIKSQNINTNNNFSVCPVCNGMGQYYSNGQLVNCVTCDTKTNTNLKLESGKGLSQFTYYEWIQYIKENDKVYPIEYYIWSLLYSFLHKNATMTEIEDAYFKSKLNVISLKNVDNTIIPISYLNGKYTYAPGYSFKRLDNGFYEMTIYSDMFKKAKGSEFVIDPVKVVVDLASIKSETNTVSAISYEENRNSMFSFNVYNLPALSGISACGEYVNMDPAIYDRKYSLIGFKKDYKDRNDQYIPIYPISTSALYQDQYIDITKKAQELNYFTHCKTNTFDYPWNYNEVMNFVLYKDENRHITPNFDHLLMADSNYGINWALKGQTRNCNLYNPLDTHKIAFSPCEPDNCASVNGRNLTYNLDTCGDIKYNNIAKQIMNDNNFYHYNQLIFNKEEWPEITDTYYHYEGSSQRAYPVYEGIYYKNIPGTYDSYDSYAWLRTSAREADEYKKDYFTGNLDTIEFNKDYENHYFLFLDKHPIKSIYYKEQFVTPTAEGYDKLLAGGYGYLTGPGWDNKVNVNEHWDLSTNFYPIKDPHPYNLYGVSAFRHVCPTCFGIGVKGITTHAGYNGSGSTSPYGFEYHKDHEWRCPTCAGRGVRIRYMYFDHDLLTSGHTSVYTDERRAKELLYETSGDPYKYWYYDGVTFSSVKYNFKNIFKYIDVSGVDLDSDGKIYEPDSGYHTTAFSAGQMFRWENNMDEVIGFSAFEPKVGAWSRIYFDNDYIRQRWDVNHRFDDFMTFQKEQIYIDKKDHDHDIEDNDADLKRDTYESSFNDLNFHSASSLYETCKICNGTGEIEVQETDDDGNVKHDIYGRAIIKTIVCPTCVGDKRVLKNYDEHYKLVPCSHCNSIGKEECPNCHGAGTVAGETCKICNGSKEIQCTKCNGFKFGYTESLLVAPDREKDKYVWKVRNKRGVNCDNLSVELYPYEIPNDEPWTYQLVSNVDITENVDGVIIKEEKNAYGENIIVKPEVDPDGDGAVVSEDFKQSEEESTELNHSFGWQDYDEMWWQDNTPIDLNKE